MNRLFVIFSLLTLIIPALAAAATPSESAINEPTVTLQEPKKVGRGFSLGAGPAMLGNLNQKGVGMNVHGSLFWDLSRVLVNVLVDFTFRGDAGAAMLGVGTRYFFTQTKVAPYVGGELGIGATRSGATALLSNAYGAGVAGSVDVGVHFMRQRRLNIDLGLRAMTVLRSSSEGIPYSGMLQATFFWL